MQSAKTPTAGCANANANEFHGTIRLSNPLVEPFGKRIERRTMQNNRVGILYRHGDVMIQRIDRLPSNAQQQVGATLAHGEATGHSHRFAQSNLVQLWERNGTLFLEVKATSAALVHEEHHRIDVPQGFYRYWKQREYRPDAFVEVED
jgi:hypothetical protein